MTSLTGRLPKNTYKDLLQVSNSNGGIDGTLRVVEDGEATASPLKLSSSAIELGGTVTVATAATVTVNGTISDLGSITTADINGGTIDGAVIGGASAAAGTFTTLAATSGTVGGANIVTVSGTQTLTNKTLTAPTLGGAVATATGTTFGNIVMASGKTIGLEDGSNSAPAIYFNDDPNTGIYRLSADDLAFAIGGSKAVTFETSQGGVTTVTLTGVGGTANDKVTSLQFSSGFRIMWLADSAKMLYQSNTSSNPHHFQGSKIDMDCPIEFTPGTSVTPTNNGDVVVEATNNTTLTFKLKGSDGTVRSATLTLS